MGHMSDEPARLFEVDGETFQVSGSMPGRMRFDWLTGPNEGYGFNSASNQATNEMITDDVIVRSIRNFLSGIDPNTGYLSEDD